MSRASEIRWGILLARRRPGKLTPEEWARYCESVFMPQSILGGVRPNTPIFRAFHRTLSKDVK